MKTLLLENDDWYWAGLEDFCNSIDPDFKKYHTDFKDWMISQDYNAAGMLSQPFIENLIVASAFEQSMYVPYITDDRERKYTQVEHYLHIIEAAINVREKCGYKPFAIHLNYHGSDFAQDVINEEWGWDFTSTLTRITRQNPETFIVKVYKEYKEVYTLSEKLFDSLKGKFND